ncbi:menaquinone biosynthetic enzyme MqnA/MqnD family protein [Aporhodopirellula aestuarii]|uniref:Chorismate dehydratase n=1 Tax=Aporhodopirellula aestuarii TaxID=2950107 RepID=A0ABT0U1P9_9BACT|nr:menaquinone biosynthesis protein [Aporhodopirellula aestuarii]MCM2370480.1 menaquinone biosynthesis protein [Aporhodopirellula aestuarii]
MLRFGAVSYLNTKPLVETLDERLMNWGTLRLDLPSRLASDLANGELDVALIPSVEYFRNQADYEIVSNAAIACRGPVWSVRLLSRVPIPEIQTVALDEGSRTSAAMAQVLLSEMHSLRPKTVPFPIGSEAADLDADAVLMIGDRAMHPPHGTYQEIWDLGDRWCRWTELPFVFAMWVARREVTEDPKQLERINETLNASRDDGVQRFESIAIREAASQGLTNEDLHRYFAENLHFYMGPGERSGLALFRKKAEAIGLVPPLSVAPGPNA